MYLKKVLDLDAKAISLGKTDKTELSKDDWVSISQCHLWGVFI